MKGTEKFKPRNGNGRATNDEILGFWAANAGQPGAEMPTGRGSVFTGGKNDDTIYSYGTHFPLARVMKAPRGKTRGWFLVNGDQWPGAAGYGGGRGGHTSYQQRVIRRVIAKTGLPFMIVPFSCLTRAGIHEDTIRPVEVLRDRTERVTRREYRAQVPSWIWDSLEHGYGLYQIPGGRWEWDEEIHVLGESLFSAEYNATFDRAAYRWRRRRGLFLSGFDRQEPGLSYFLCQLPAGYRGGTVAEAFEALRPQAVADAEAAGLEVLRQGDVFAVPVDLRTRDLPGPSQRSAYVLGVNHTATEVRCEDSAVEYPPCDGRGTWARGTLRHRPRDGRRPDHVRRVLGDQRTWYRLYKNAVPVDDHGHSRAWASAGGRARVD